MPMKPPDIRFLRAQALGLLRVESTTPAAAATAGSVPVPSTVPEASRSPAPAGVVDSQVHDTAQAASMRTSELATDQEPELEPKAVGTPPKDASSADEQDNCSSAPVTMSTCSSAPVVMSASDAQKTNSWYCLSHKAPAGPAGGVEDRGREQLKANSYVA